ncbi:MAG: double-strand break repair protein AddB [Alphaproteobacteria bacterium]|nr:double-strand break repair protein AddB [Alphaproteobacteria bacterium]
MTGAPRVTTIPAHEDFLRRLAEGLVAQAGGDLLKLSDTRIFLPTRRACRVLAEKFLEVSDASAAVLPTIRPFGDLEEDESLPPEITGMAGGLPEPMPKLQRQMLLTRLVMEREGGLGLDRAAQLAAALAGLLDQMQREEIDDPAVIARLVPENYAAHWQEVVRFLAIVTAEWPKILAERNMCDPMAWRVAMLRAQADAWEKSPPPWPVIAAGSTGSMPSTARLLRVIAHMPRGTVVLPGLDRAMDGESWQAAGDTHPQASIKRLLGVIGAAREQVNLWPGCKTATTPRTQFIAETLRPAAVSDGWRALRDAPFDADEALAGLQTVTAASLQEEATVIALAIREALEDRSRQVALVTANRNLAERVRMGLCRWGIEANDTAGRPLDGTRLGSFMRLVLAGCGSEAGAVDFLALLKHPLAACGHTRIQCRVFARAIERTALRGPKLGAGPGAIVQALQDAGAEESLLNFTQLLGADLARLGDMLHGTCGLHELLAAHTALCERLAAKDGVPGADILWTGDDGKAAADWLSEWSAAAAEFPPIKGCDYPALFSAMMTQAVVRPRGARSAHPRVQIMGTLEARLLHADMVILGGMNEGSWPPAPPLDPWMSRPMRQDFGLPSPEERTGHAAHDFAQLAAMPHVLVTRAAREGRAPTVPSRLLLRLGVTVQALGRDGGALGADDKWLGLARALDRPEGPPAPMQRPAPSPPRAARPMRFTVTDIGLLMRNPYGFYAKRVLKLKPLDPLDAPPTAAEQGSFIHDILHAFMERHRDGIRNVAEAERELIDAGRGAYQKYLNYPAVEAFWWPRFAAIARAFVKRQCALQQTRAYAAGECEAALPFQAGGAEYLLEGRADRIDRTQGGYAICDYKTGRVPSKDEVKHGYEPQLALLGWMAEAGAFKGLAAGGVDELSYWHVYPDEAGGAPRSRCHYGAEETRALIDEARAGLEEIVAAYASDTAPYHVIPVAKYRPHYDDYAHLARIAEWSAADGEEA